MSRTYHISGYILASFALLFFSCKEKKKAAEEKPTIVVDTPMSSFKKPPTISSDTIVIDSPAAVFFNPDTVQYEQIRQNMPVMNYESLRHDCFYQMRNARIVMRQSWKKLKIVEAGNARCLLFIKENKAKTYIDMNITRDICGIYLFEPQKEPELIDMMNIDTALEFYFRH